MVIILSLRWWYSAGWKWAWQRSVTQRVRWCIETFSIPQLIQTWFSPFKQTFTARKRGSFDAQIHALIDNFVSRVIGFIARTFIILTGALCMLFSFISGILLIVVWPFIPALPLIAIILTVAKVGV